MGSSTFLLFCYSFLLTLPTLTLSQLRGDVYYEYNCTQTSGNYTANSPYETNLNSIISRFATLTDFNNGFFNLPAGESPDKVFSISLCRGDMKQADCNSCLNYTATVLKQLCPLYKAATAWSQYCLVRYSNLDLYGLLENDPHTCVYNLENVSNPDEFNQALSDLLVSLSSEAAAGGSLRKYAAGSAEAGNLKTVYAMVQCTPDMDQRNCTTCLNYARSELQNCCSGRRGCRVLRPTCVLRFETDPFFNPIGGKGSNTTRTIIIAVASVVGALTLIIISVSILIRRRRKRFILLEDETVDDHEIPGVDSLQFSFGAVSAATNNFSDANQLGQGGFGAVYKGELPNGQEIAVKRLSRGSGQGDIEFKTEVELLAKLQHRNLVRLVGFCLHGQERLLIYEFVINASLDRFIFDRIKRAQLDWETRFKIIGGIVRGLLYLHKDSRLRIIHRDLKASNILLDAEMVPKIADFGMARLFAQDDTHASTRRIAGTFGYMAPEYVKNGHLSEKSDVFSFGVLLLEIISGQKCKSFRHGDDEEYILSFAWRIWREGRALDLVDPTLADGSRNEMMRCIHIALLCVQENVAARPNMDQVDRMLNSFATTLEEPSQSAFAMHSNSEADRPSTFVSSTNNSNTELLPVSHNEVTNSELLPR